MLRNKIFKFCFFSFAILTSSSLLAQEDMDYAERLFDDATDKLNAIEIGQEANYQAHFNKIKHSADMGYVEAIAYFGCELTKTGFSMLNRDAVKGERYLNKAIEKNSSHAMVCMAYHLYEIGNIFETIEYLERAYLLGDYGAATELGYLSCKYPLSSTPESL